MTRDPTRIGVSIATVATLLFVGAGCHRMVRPSVAAEEVRVASAVVTVHVHGQNHDLHAPWSRSTPFRRRATGLVVEVGGAPRILVQGEIVANHTFVEVEKHGDDRPWPAKVQLVDYEASLALIEVADPGFFEDLFPMVIADEAPAEGEVTIHRWLGTGRIESARATVRQVGVASHGRGGVGLLTLDLATTMQNAGRSEVVVKDGRVVGIVTRAGRDDASAIAAPMLRQFIEDAAEAPYHGFARGGFYWQRLTNPALRRFLSLEEGEGGVRVTRVLPHGSVASTLREGDVIVEIRGVPIDASGRYSHPLYGRLGFGLLFTDGVRPPDTIPVGIIRDGERQVVDVALRRMAAHEDRVPRYEHDEPPGWFMYGGFVFGHLTRPYLETWREWRTRAPLRLRIAYDLEGNLPSSEKPRFVILQNVLADEVNLGYQDLRALIVTHVNGAPVGTIEDVRAAFEDESRDFHVVELLPGQPISRIVIDAAEARRAHGRIAERYGLP